MVTQKEINAFALPGGPMFINIGTITASPNEAELAGAMAHEMSHMYMQHSAKQASKASQGGTPPQWLSDHPNPGNREQAIEKEIQGWPPKNYADSSPAFQKARLHAVGVKAYTSEEIAQGAKSGQWSALNKTNGATFNPAQHE